VELEKFYEEAAKKTKNTKGEFNGLRVIIAKFGKDFNNLLENHKIELGIVSPRNSNDDGMLSRSHNAFEESYNGTYDPNTSSVNKSQPNMRIKSINMPGRRQKPVEKKLTKIEIYDKIR
jgi:hypothetical protein